MAPPNESKDTPKVTSTAKANLFSLQDGNLTVSGGAATLLSGVPENVTLTPFATAFDPSSSSCDAPELAKQAMAAAHRGAFLGFTAPAATDRAPCRVGWLKRRRFLSVFRFKTWWSTMWAGERGGDLQMETQWVLLDVPEIGGYVLLLPLVQGSFRSAIFPGDDDGVVVCAESGSTAVTATDFRRIAYVHAGDDPFRLMHEAYTAARVHLGTFRLIEEKALPPMAERFGWCTWDAFYLTVDPAGVWQGVSELADAGVPPRFVIIDDGWQSVNRDEDPPHEDAPGLVLGGDQMTARLYRFDECARFHGYREGALLRRPPEMFYDKSMPKVVVRKAAEVEAASKAKKKAAAQGGAAAADLSLFDAKIEHLRRELEQLLARRGDILAKLCGDDGGHGGGEVGLKAFVKDMNRRFPGLDDVYVWQALCGGWGGVRPGETALDARVGPVRPSPGLAGTMDDLAVDRIIEGGIGLVRPNQAGDLYNSMHSYLAGAGVTGVKVDVIHTLEYVCEDHGGRVELAKAYYDGLSKSIANNFSGNGIIASMQQCNDFFFLGATRQVAMARAGDDFWFEDPNGDPMGVFWLQGAHMVNCAYNSLWMGQFIRPDWDMFQSDHACAAFHAASRAICGGPVYVSDSLGCHDFALLRRLVFPDGTVPMCLHYALPTRDCLFKNPLFDQETVLKIWNLNKFGGVIGAFNCQGAGWDPSEHRVRGYSHCYKPVSGEVRPADVEWSQREDTSDMANAAEYAVYRCQSDELVLMTPQSQPIQFTIQPSSFELFTFAPVTMIGDVGARFAPIGLVNMLNCGGTIVDVECRDGSEVKVKVNGAGRLLVFSSVRPQRCLVDGFEDAFEWENGGKLMVDVSWKKDKNGVSDVVFCY
ncbi:hypothetical protein E2562_024334 [Oryza meyeriana var. granulata]|uniref:galactinol--sucrose galactosyltransferase n=1 Tax=Oryza meyeriana var. granulata TaxID=110450 RepID=A0A6G1C8D4_9ORYZ|nr:hypothetical protein E2562_024334 [Oryza meyeriana var. granulata]